MTTQNSINAAKSIVIVLLMILGVCNAYAQDFISIVGSTPYSNGTEVFFEGYEGFELTDLGSTRANAKGEIDYFTSYHGYCKMYSKGGSSWTLILENDPTCIEWNDGFSFSCDEANGVYYEMLSGFLYIDTLLFRHTTEEDSLSRINNTVELDQSLTNMKDQLGSMNDSQVVTFLEGELLLRIAMRSDSLNQMTEIKEEIISFVVDNYDALYHSDYLIRLAQGYMGMNSRGFRTSESARAASMYDVGEWLSNLNPMMEERDILNFFISDFMMMGETEIASSLADKYVDIVKCDQYVKDKLRPVNMPYEFNVFGGADLSKIYSLDQFYGMPKILAIYDTECPASMAALTGLYDFMFEKQLRMPVILIPNGEHEASIKALLKREAPFGLQAGAKTGSSLMLGAGVKQLPAFIVLDDKNLLKTIHYGLTPLKDDFSD